MVVVLLAGDGRGFLESTLLHAQLDRAGLEARIVYVGGELDRRIREGALRELRGPEPALTLGVDEDSDPAAVAQVVEAFKEHIEEHPADALVVMGDTDAAMTCCLAAAKNGTPIARVDAGRRGAVSSSREVNHVIMDRLASHHFVSDPEAMGDLLAEGVSKKKAYFVGNLLTDVFSRLQDRERSRRMLSAFHLTGQPYAAVFLDRHRSEPALALEMLQKVADQIQVLHLVDSPRPTSQREPIMPDVPGVRVVDTETLRELLILLEHARIIITDSDLVQEAAAYFEVPCLTVGRPIERPVTVTAGCNQAAPFDPDAVAESAAALLARESDCSRPPLWDGEVAGRIVDILVRSYGERLAEWISSYFVESHRARKELLSS